METETSFLIFDIGSNAGSFADGQYVGGMAVVFLFFPNKIKGYT